MFPHFASTRINLKIRRFVGSYTKMEMICTLQFMFFRNLELKPFRFCFLNKTLEKSQEVACFPQDALLYKLLQIST